MEWGELKLTVPAEETLSSATGRMAASNSETKLCMTKKDNKEAVIVSESGDGSSTGVNRAVKKQDFLDVVSKLIDTMSKLDQSFRVDNSQQSQEGAPLHVDADVE